MSALKPGENRLQQQVSSVSSRKAEQGQAKQEFSRFRSREQEHLAQVALRNHHRSGGKAMPAGNRETSTPDFTRFSTHMPPRSEYGTSFPTPYDHQNADARHTTVTTNSRRSFAILKTNSLKSGNLAAVRQAKIFGGSTCQWFVISLFAS